MSLITIITPTYNRAKHLPTLFNSLLNQKKYNFDWLIIDDGSNDETALVISTFVTHNFKINYLKKENG